MTPVTGRSWPDVLVHDRAAIGTDPLTVYCVPAVCISAALCALLLRRGSRVRTSRERRTFDCPRRLEAARIGGHRPADIGVDIDAFGIRERGPSRLPTDPFRRDRGSWLCRPRRALETRHDRDVVRVRAARAGPAARRAKPWRHRNASSVKMPACAPESATPGNLRLSSPSANTAAASIRRRQNHIALPLPTGPPTRPSSVSVAYGSGANAPSPNTATVANPHCANRALAAAPQPLAPFGRPKRRATELQHRFPDPALMPQIVPAAISNSRI